MKNFSSYDAHKEMLTSTPMNLICNSPTFLTKKN